MKCFYPERHGGHAPAWYIADGVARRCPEVPARVEAIVAALREAGHEVAGARGEGISAAVGATHDAGYLEYLREIHGAWAAEFGTGDVLPDTFVPRAVGGRRVRIPEKLSARAGWYCFDMAAPIGPGTWEAAVDSAACAERAAEEVLRGGGGAYAVCRPPGHHAGRDYCGGFCFLNNAAVAANRLRAGGMKKVAVVDVDYHHGNGTQDIFYEDGGVMFVSVHAEPGTQYPYFWGYAEERGAGAGAGLNVNLPLARGCSVGKWFEALGEGLAAVKRFGGEGVVVSLGVDTAGTDGMGDFRLGVGEFEEVGRLVRGLGVPTVWVQEGGYDVGRVGKYVRAVVGGVIG